MLTPDDGIEKFIRESEDLPIAIRPNMGRKEIIKKEVVKDESEK
jgi:hypothetical protein